MKLLTIIVPSFNVDKTLCSTLNSLCIDDIIDELDVIVVDDESTDDTAVIAKSFAERYPFSVKVITKVNGGHGSAVNAGVEAAQGIYFKVVDGDDRLDKKGLITLVNQIKITSADLLVAPYVKVDVNDETNLTSMNFEDVEFGKLYNFNDLPLDRNLYFGIHSMTIKTSIFKNNNLKLQENTFYVDVEYGLLPIPFIKTVEFLNVIIYKYYVGNSGQSISHSNFVKRYDDHFRVVMRMTEYYINFADNEMQFIYMNSVLQKVCFTNYMLSVFYDDDVKRGKIRAKEFDTWLKKNGGSLYNDLNKSLYIRFLRITGFKILPNNKFFKHSVEKIYSVFKPLLKKRNKLTY